MADKVELHETEIRAFFESPEGPIGQDLQKRADRVKVAAKAQVGKKYAKGVLARAIDTRFERARKPHELRISIGSNLPDGHDMMHHNGTKPHEILPRRRKMLRYVKDGQVVFSLGVTHPGFPGNPYLLDNLPLAGGVSRVR